MLPGVSIVAFWMIREVKKVKQVQLKLWELVLLLVLAQAINRLFCSMVEGPVSLYYWVIRKRWVLLVTAE